MALNNVDKRKLLRQLLAGERPVATIYVTDITNSVTIVSIRAKRKDLSETKYLRTAAVPPYIEQLKSEHTLYKIEIVHISREECEAIEKRLEEEY